jgi:hypothetical protein
MKRSRDPSRWSSGCLLKNPDTARTSSSAVRFRVNTGCIQWLVMSMMRSQYLFPGRRPPSAVVLVGWACLDALGEGPKLPGAWRHARMRFTRDGVWRHPASSLRRYLSSSCATPCLIFCLDAP